MSFIPHQPSIIERVLMCIFLIGVVGCVLFSLMIPALEKAIQEQEMSEPVELNWDDGVVDVIFVQIPIYYKDTIFNLLKLFALIVISTLILMNLPRYPRGGIR